jgi:hypothetical protein
MFADYRKLAAQVGPWVAITLYIYAWTWKNALGRTTPTSGGRAVTRESMSPAGLQTAANHT